MNTRFYFGKTDTKAHVYGIMCVTMLDCNRLQSILRIRIQIFRINILIYFFTELFGHILHRVLTPGVLNI